MITYLDKQDAYEYIEGKKCIYLVVRVAEFLADFEEVASIRKPTQQGCSDAWQSRFQVQMDLQATLGEERQAKVEPMIRIFHKKRTANPAERQHHAKDFQIRRHRTDTG